MDSTAYNDVAMYKDLGILFNDEDMTFNEQFEGGWVFGKRKKHITMHCFSSGPTLIYGPQKNLFRDSLSWKIEKLSKKEFWLSTTNGGSRYYIKFKNLFR